MDIRKSELQQVSFVVLDTKIEYQMLKSNQSVIQDDLDIDFGLWKNDKDDHLFRVWFKIRAKRIVSKEVGLDIYVYACSDFVVDSSLSSDSDLFVQLVKYSTVAITYNNIRGYIQQITSFYPVPTYLLPTINVNDLWNKKDSEEEIKPPIQAKKRKATKKSVES